MREELARLGTDVHALSRRLHPSVLDDLGLEEALRVEAERFGENGSIRVVLELADLHGELPEDAALCLYRIAQEALTNVTRHARAGRVTIALRRAASGCELVVSDDGVGFDPQAQRAGPSLGLPSMRERARLMGGRLAVESAPGRGATVTAWVPLADGRDA